MSGNPDSNSARKPLMRKMETRKATQTQALRKKMQETGAPKAQKRRKNETKRKKESPSLQIPPPVPFRPPCFPEQTSLSASNGSKLSSSAPFVIARRKGAVVTQKM